MPRGIPSSGKRKPRSTGTKSKDIDWYQLYYDWWDVFGCNIEKTLLAYHLYNKSTSNGTPREIWSSNKYNHKQEYQEAKTAYFQSLGITRECLILRINDISLNARYETNRLEATKYLYEILEKARDNSAVEQAQRLVISFEDNSKPDDSVDVRE